MYLILYTVIVLCLVLVYMMRRRYWYWKERNVKYLEPTFLLGNYGAVLLQRRNMGETVQELCRRMDVPMFGAFYGTEPVLVVQDPALVKLVLTKEFHHFSGREVSQHVHKEPATKNLFFFSGDKWKVLRQNLSPIFSTSKMKLMFPLIEKCSATLERLLREEIKVSDVFEIRALMSRYTVDCIASCVFGIDSDVMGDDLESNPFKIVADEVSHNSAWKGFTVHFRALYPTLFYGLKMELFPSKMMALFTQVSRRVCDERGNRKSPRNDFVDLLIDIKNKGCVAGDGAAAGGDDARGRINVAMDDEMIAANCFLYFSAGFETSATTAAFVLWELARHPAAQAAAAAEAGAYLAARGGRLGYDCVTELPFLDRCVQETLRLYPVLPVLAREVTEPLTLPGGLHLPRGLRVHVPLYHLQRHPKYFPQPEKFDPDRFLNGHIEPYTYFPFGEGPRICIGMRFAKMQLLAGLVTILRSYRVEPTSAAGLTLDPAAMISQSKHPIRLRLTPRDA